MDDFAKQASSYQLDQEILDARGINMTVEEVAGLPTCKYSERVQSLHLSEDDLVFLKGLRRRIKNRLASQNSRRRNTEQLRRLARELRALRASRHAALAERRALLAARGQARERCEALRDFVVKVLNDRSDPTEVPELDPEGLFPDESQSRDSISIPSPVTDSPSPNPGGNCVKSESHADSLSPVHKEFYVERDKHIAETPSPILKAHSKERERHISDSRSPVLKDYCAERDRNITSSRSPVLKDYCVERDKNINGSRSQGLKEFRVERERCLVACSPVLKRVERDRHTSPVLKEYYGERDRHIFECRIEKLVQQSVNHIYKEKKKITAKTVFITDEAGKGVYDVGVGVGGVNGIGDGEVLNLSLKRRSHGRKQSAPRRIACVYADNDDGVLDLKIKKESH